jgi:hypothetical protein
VPKIPNHQIIDDNWEDPEEFNIETDEPTDRAGRKITLKPPREDREWEEKRRNLWRKRNTWD